MIRLAASTNNNDKASKPADANTTAESAATTNTATLATEKGDAVKSEKGKWSCRMSLREMKS